MSELREISVNADIRLIEVGLNDVEAIFTTIDKERDYLQVWLPFVELTREISFTHQFVVNYLNSDRLDLTCAVYYQNKFVGIVGLKDTDLDNEKTEIGYWLSESYQHKGIITLSCRAMIDYVFDEMDLNRIQLKAAIGNLKSQQVAKRLGFILEGIERDGELLQQGFVDLMVHSLLKAER